MLNALLKDLGTLAIKLWIIIYSINGLWTTLFVSHCAQISTSVNDQASVAQASATTPLATTPASALWTTCRSTEGTTAWVGPRGKLSQCCLSLQCW